jgi:DnaJ like chaperone protein
MNLYAVVSRFKEKIVKALNFSFPRRLWRWRRPGFAAAIGGLIGSFGGFAGILIGLLLGYLVHELFSQFKSDKVTSEYFENPGSVNFYEGEPGIAACCALGIIIASQSVYPGQHSSLESGEAVTEQTVRNVLALFPGQAGERPIIESFCHIAFSRRASLNPDLLAESLAARRKSQGDLKLIAETLQSLAFGETAEELAEHIRFILDPNYRPHPKEAAPDWTKDPWAILGLKPGSSRKEVKSQFRRLVIQFHPDARHDLNETRRQEAARTFITIKEAYREIMRQGFRDPV